MRGFGFTQDLATGKCRHWYAKADGIRRWVDNDRPIEEPHMVDEDAIWPDDLSAELPSERQ